MLAILRGLRREPDAPERPGTLPRVLVVEDEAVMQRFYACFFDKLHAEEFGWRLARDGGEALKALEADPPDIVLLDWMLPSVPGPAVLKAIRAHPKTRGLGVMVVTAKSAPGDAALALEEGADDFLSKPFDERVLLARLHSLLRRQQALRSVEDKLRRSQRLEALGLLVGGVAHDFNNMLTAIKGFAELLVQGFASGAARRDDAEEIVKASERAESMTRQLLDFSREQPARSGTCDVNRIVTEMAQMLRRLLREDIELSLSLAPTLAPAQAGTGQLAQVVVNLAVNARDAMPRGGVLSITTDEAAPSPEFFRERPGLEPGPYVRLCVSDTGEGMDRATLQCIFDPFFTTKKAGRGTGMGLSIVHDIVEQNGGDIVVRSEPGAGCRFEVFLPRAAAAAPTAPAGPEPAPAAAGELVLLVEDDETVRRLAARMLKAAGYRVIAAQDADEALLRIRETGEPVRMLLTDVVLPGIDGPELARRLVSRFPGLKVLFLSGYLDETLAQHGLLGEDTALLSKPFTQDALARKVRGVLGPDPAPQRETPR
jgi:signal transduction histidine kinase